MIGLKRLLIFLSSHLYFFVLLHEQLLFVHHLGTTEFWGMFASVSFGILLVPGLYALFQTWREWVKGLFSRTFESTRKD